MAAHLLRADQQIGTGGGAPAPSPDARRGGAGGPVVLLGIDPGTRVVGWGVVAAEGNRLRFVEAGVLAPDAKLPVERRLAEIAEGLREIVRRHRPAEAAVEEVFVKADARAALMIGQGRGAALAVLGAAGVRVTGYPPATIKRAIAGNGKAEKGQVARMVGALLGLASPPTPADATDALATALCHALRFRLQTLVR